MQRRGDGSRRTLEDVHDASLLHSHLLRWLWERPESLALKDFVSVVVVVVVVVAVVNSLHSHLDLLCRRRRRRCRRRRQQFYRSYRK